MERIVENAAMKNQRNCVVFDLDGTLVDTIADIAWGFNHVFDLHGRQTYSLETYKSFVGWGLAKVIDFAAGNDVSKEQKALMLEQITGLYAENPVRYSSIYPGMMDLLNKIRTLDLSLGVYSNKKEELTVKIVRELFPDSMFDFVLGATDSKPLKPDPAALLAHVKEHNLAPVLMIGDSPVDVETARRASIPFAGVTWGFRSKKDLCEAGSVHNFDDADALKKWMVSRMYGGSLERHQSGKLG